MDLEKVALRDACTSSYLACDNSSKFFNIAGSILTVLLLSSDKALNSLIIWLLDLTLLIKPFSSAKAINSLFHLW